MTSILTIILTDFEYCSYNYRAFDIANHFLEWMYDYTAKEEPFFKANHDNYPSEMQRLQFIRTYLDETDSKENATDLLKEVEVFTLASHMFWALWGIVNTKTSQIPFGYWEYADERINSYFRMKEQVQQPQRLKRKVNELLMD